MTNKHRAALFIGTLILLLGSRTRMSGQEPPLSDYSVTSWTTKDGLSSSVIWALTQDTDGYLWLGTNNGLVRFDGAQFLTYSSLGGTPLPKLTVRSLFRAHDGSLWIGFIAGKISHFHGGQLTTYSESEEGPGTITSFAEDRSGTMWAGSTTGLLTLDGGRWERSGGSTGLREARISTTYISKHGDLFVGSEIGIFKFRSDRTFERVDPSSDTTIFRGFAEDLAGQMWISDPVVGFRHLGERRAVPAPEHKARGNYILSDREGNLWVATMGQGIWRVNPNHPSSPEKINVFGPRTMIEDRNGSIWAGTGESLVRLEKPSVKRITNLGLTTAVDTTPDGNVWVSTGDGLMRIPPGGDSRAQPVITAASITALHADSSGAVWVASDTSLVRFAEGKVTKWPLSRYGLTCITAITTDDRGSVWISDRNRGLFRWSLSKAGPQIDLITPQPDIIFSYTDRSGRVWFGSSHGQLGAVKSDGQLRFYTAQDGIGTASYRSMFQDHLGNLWLGGIDGLYSLRGERFVRIGELPQNRRLSVSAISEDNDGDIWVSTGSGLGFIRRRDLDSALATPEKQVGQVAFDISDGLAGMPVWFNSLSLVRTADDKLWSVTGRGITVLNPHLLKTPQAPATVRIDNVVLDERPSGTTYPSTLSSHTNRVQIDYSALQLDFAHPIQFRYRLEGFDKDWINADTHRQAVYTHLPARHYVFRVVASNSDGSWSDVAATWNFSIQPAFYQTYLFLSVCILGVGALIWAAWGLHVRRIRHEFAVVLAERMRLSRELHDTLLQSLVGVALQFDAASGHLPPSSPTHHRLVAIRKQVEQYIRDARRSIFNLRSPMLASQDLPTALRESVARATNGQTVQSRMSVHGTPCPATSVVEQELLHIGREAILNVMKHSHASQLNVELSYEGEVITLRVADDGCGFDPAHSPDEIDGHFGLVTMKERAEHAGGQLKLSTDIGMGTVVEATFPSHTAA